MVKTAVDAMGESTVNALDESAVSIAPRLVLMQCTSSYPCRPVDTNLPVILTYRQAFPSIIIGYSGH